jgi:hypothetical protein
MIYECELENGQHREIDNEGDQTFVGFSRRGQDKIKPKATDSRPASGLEILWFVARAKTTSSTFRRMRALAFYKFEATRPLSWTVSHIGVMRRRLS